ncbi:MAG: phosphatase PAP2 family protein [Acidobacteria bacterium]|nr:phosphatase PAP2 family protein [Acidobacteriota bacterium]
MRRSEWLLAAFFIYIAALALVWPLDRAAQAGLGLANAGIVAGLALLARSNREGVAMPRDWYALALVLAAYQEVGWFAPAHHAYSLERFWIYWDRLLLRDWGLKAAVEFFGPLLPALLELSYSLVYALAPFSMALLYGYGRRRRSERFLFIFVLGVLLAYAQFPFWPSEPPRTVFPGEDAPSLDTPFRRFNWWLLEGAGIHTSVFPSAHVSGAFSCAWGMMRALPDRKWAGRFLAVMAALIAVATIYGRYHYAVDALAGLGLSAAAVGIAALIEVAREAPEKDA